MTDERNAGDLVPLTPLTYHVLLALADEERHGYAILKEVFDASGGAIDLDTGTLYAAIKRLREDDLIEVVPSREGEDKRRRNYQLSSIGWSVLEVESRRLEGLLARARMKGVLATGGS